MPYEMYENAEGWHIHGNCFMETLAIDKPLFVDGDLIAHYVAAPSLYAVRGSVIVKSLNVDYANVDILGVFLTDGLVRATWSYNWLRPVIELPREDAWTSEVSIENVARMLEHPGLVTKPEIAARLVEKVRRRPTCGRARVLFLAALEELHEHDGLTPLGISIVSCFLTHDDLPKDWRF